MVVVPAAVVPPVPVPGGVNVNAFGFEVVCVCPCVDTAAPKRFGAAAVPVVVVPPPKAATALLLVPATDAEVPPNAKPPPGVDEGAGVAEILAEELKENIGFEAAPVPGAVPGAVACVGVALALAPKAPKVGVGVEAAEEPKAPPPKVGVEPAVGVALTGAPNEGEA